MTKNKKKKVNKIDILQSIIIRWDKWDDFIIISISFIFFMRGKIINTDRYINQRKTKKKQSIFLKEEEEEGSTVS